MRSRTRCRIISAAAARICGSYARSSAPRKREERAMNAPLTAELARRDFLKGTGALIVGFSIAGAIGGSAAAMEIGPYGPPEDQVDSWIAIGEDGRATLFTGCCELGTGSSTGLMQILAEELDLP